MLILSKGISVKKTASILTSVLITLIFLSHNSGLAADKYTRAANWVIETTDGKTISLNEELQKDRKVVIIFWSTWCRHCHEVLPKLNQLMHLMQLSQSSNQAVTFVALNIWEDGDPSAYMQKHGLSIPLALKAESIAAKYGVQSAAEVFVIGENNRLLYRRRSDETASMVIAAVKQHLDLN